jgi:hypothetical protein
MGVKGGTWIHRPTSACIQPPLRSNPEHSLLVVVHHTILSRYDRYTFGDKNESSGHTGQVRPDQQVRPALHPTTTRVQAITTSTNTL